MINPGQFVLELFLVVAALALSRSLGKTRHRRFVIGLSVRLQDAGVASGFALLRQTQRLGRVLIVGVAVGVFVTGTVYLLSFVERLVGEEIFARLGAQSLALYAFRRLRGGAVFAIILSSLYFEIWHNPFEVPQLLNFSASCVLGWAYQKYGYECAAVGHCVADWLMLGVLPPLLFG